MVAQCYDSTQALDKHMSRDYPIIYVSATPTPHDVLLTFATKALSTGSNSRDKLEQLP